jgi:hypothetical protein
MRFEPNPPDASSLMLAARSFGNYDLPAALADLIDNSIKAGARLVELTCDFNAGSPQVRILDDGVGMGPEELKTAMRPACGNPLDERSPDDLGRFGWGLKSASFSQCRRLTVLARRNGVLSGCVWDLDDVDGWRMGILDEAELRASTTPKLLERDGVEVIWDACDRLSENGTLTHAEFNALIVHAHSRLALIFHRYLSGDAGRHKLVIELNGQPVAPWDPFHREHPATQEFELETLEVGGRTITVQPFVLPHYSKLDDGQYDRLAGEEGFVRNQGFYVYRNNRLIISGTWFRLLRFGELSQLIRVRVDITNALDHIWKITIDKGDAQLPAVLRARLKQIVDGLRRRSARVYRSRGGRLDRPGSVSVWSRHARNGEIRYSINREHPLISALLASTDEDQRDAATAALRVIEQGFPVNTFSADAAAQLDAIHQTSADPAQFRAELMAALPALLDQADGSFGELASLLKVTEPWSGAWGLVESVLAEKGWIDGES